MISIFVMEILFLFLYSVIILGWKFEVGNSIFIFKLKLDCVKIIEIFCDNKLVFFNIRK